MSAVKLFKNDFSVKAAYLWRLDASVCSLCLMVLENDYLNAIYNLFTMTEREGSGVKTIWRWSEPGSERRLGTPLRAGRWGRWGRKALIGKKKRTDEMKWRGIAADGCHSLTESFPAFSCPLRTQITQLSASQCHSSIARSQWLSKSLGCRSPPFIIPLGSNMLQKAPLSILPIDGTQRHYQFKLCFRASGTFPVQARHILLMAALKFKTWHLTFVRTVVIQTTQTQGQVQVWGDA